MVKPDKISGNWITASARTGEVMSGTFTSWGALVQALQKEVAEATEEVVDDSLDDLYRNVDRFLQFLRRKISPYRNAAYVTTELLQRWRFCVYR